MNRGEIIDMAGKKIGRLLVLIPTRNDGTGYRWICKCDCGKEVERHGKLLRNGHTKSCGCLRREGNNHRTHGDSKIGYWQRFFRIWCDMRKRCRLKSSSNFKNY